MAIMRLIEQAEKDHLKTKDVYGESKEIAALKSRNDRSILPQELAQGDQLKGYTFRIFLAELPKPEPVAEASENEPTKTTPPLQWCAYAMPNRYGLTGHRTFFINETGQIYFIDEPKITGTNPEKIQPGLAYKDRQPFSEINSRWTPLGEEAKY